MSASKLLRRFWSTIHQNEIYIVAILVFVITLISEPMLNPDGLEMAVVGQCQLGLTPAEYSGCETLQPLYYPPIFPLISGFLNWSLGVGGMFVLSLLAAGMIVLPLSRFVEALSGQKNVTGIVAITLISVSCFSFYGMLAEPRMLSVTALFFVWGLMLRSEGKRASQQYNFTIGVLAALLMLIRPEGILVGPLLIVFAIWRVGARGFRVAAGFLAIALPWWILMSTMAGRLTVSSRSWELAGVSLLSYLPVRPLVQLWGVGASNRPMREALSGLGPSEFSSESSLIDSIFAVFADLVVELPALLLLLALVGFYVAVRSPKRRHVSVALGLVVTPSFVLAMTPVGRDVAMPLNNLLPIVFVVVIYGVVGFFWAATAIRRRMNTSTAAAKFALLLLVTVSGALSPYPNKPVPQSSESGLLAASWLNENTPDREVVASTFATSSIPHLSQRAWRPLPSRWDGASWSASDAPSWFVLSGVDGSWPLDSPMFRQDMNIEPRAIFADDHGWVLILQRTASINNSR